MYVPTKPLRRLILCLLLLFPLASIALAQTSEGTVTITTALSDKIKVIEDGPVTITISESGSSANPNWVQAVGHHTLEYEYGPENLEDLGDGLRGGQITLSD